MAAREKLPVIGITTDIKSEREETFVVEATYARALVRAGALPVFLPSISHDKSLLFELSKRIDGLLLPGGRDMDPGFYNEKPHPRLRPMNRERTESEIVFLESALKRGIPVLGICGGMQLINVFFGGSLYQDIPSLISGALSHEGGSVHDIEVMEGTLLERIVGERKFSVRSYHHQSVKAVGRGLRVCAMCPDGVIEGVESADSFILGIQWHPERENNGVAERIFRAFVEECREKIPFTAEGGS